MRAPKTTRTIKENSPMKKSVLLCAFFLGIISQTAWGEIPRTISYQGVLTDTSGATLDGDHDFVFKLYDAETGGNQLWSETHVSVTVSRGVFNVTLGSVDAFPDTIFINPRWMDHGGRWTGTVATDEAERLAIQHPFSILDIYYPCFENQ